MFGSRTETRSTTAGTHALAIGMAAGIFFILRANAKTPFFMTLREDPAGGRSSVRILLAENVTFLNKAGVRRALHELRKGTRVVIDASETRWLDRDVLEIIHEFAATAPDRGIDVELVAMPPPDARAGELGERKPIVETASR